MADLSIQYFVDAARPRTQLSLTVPKQGDAELFLGTPVSPTSAPVLGYFKVPLSGELRQKIKALVSDNDLLAGDRGTSATAEGSGWITLEASGRRAALGLATADAPVNALRAALDQVVTDAGKIPWRAVELTVEGHRDGPRWIPEVVLHHRGSEPATILLCDPSSQAFCTSPTVRTLQDKRELGSWRLERSDAVALVRAGRIPEGAFSLALGQEVRIAAAPVETTAPSPAMTATLGLWFVGPGPARRSVELSAESPVHRD